MATCEQLQLYAQPTLSSITHAIPSIAVLCAGVLPSWGPACAFGQLPIAAIAASLPSAPAVTCVALLILVLIHTAPPLLRHSPWPAWPMVGGLAGAGQCVAAPAPAAMGPEELASDAAGAGNVAETQVSQLSVPVPWEIAAQAAPLAQVSLVVSIAWAA